MEKLLQGEGGNQIDVHTLMRECAGKHEEREAMSVMRQVWQRSRARGKLREKRSSAAGAGVQFRS